jgi:putative ABC transport system substrate-binding protein
MRLIGLAVVLAFGFALVPVEAHTQQAGKVYRVGYLFEGPANAIMHPSLGTGLNGLRQGLRALGWTEGDNLVIEARYAEGKPERLAGLAAELIRLNVDVIVALPNTPTALAAKKATTTVPVVMMAADPVAAGLVASLAKPGGNITGVAVLNTEIVVKRVELLLEAVPGISEIGYLVRADNPGTVQAWEVAKAAAAKLGVKLRRFDVNPFQPVDLERAIAMVANQRLGAMLVPADQSFYDQRSLIGALAKKHRLPWVTAYPASAEAGALLSYGPDNRDVWQRLVRLVDKILKGAKPADLPVEQVAKFELAVNKKTAKALGLTIPQTLLLRADLVIE